MAILNEVQKKELNKQRIQAVRQAWENEHALVAQNLGTRRWSSIQQKEILETGRVRRYEGHHMKSVRAFPQHAGDPRNIQLLTEKEHLQAHRGDFRKPTNGYYNPYTGRIEHFRGKELRPAPVHSLVTRQLQRTVQQEQIKKTFRRKIC